MILKFISEQNSWQSNKHTSWKSFILNLILSFIVSCTIVLPICAEPADSSWSEIEKVRKAREADYGKPQSFIRSTASRTTGDIGDVIKTIPAPDDAGQGLAWDGTLWHSQSFQASQGAGIYDLDPADRAILKSFPPPPSHPKDMAYDGEFLWCVDFIDDAIYKIHPDTGAILDSIPAPSGIASGLAWDGENFWVSEWLSDTVYKIARDGTVLDSFFAPGSPDEEPYGLTWDGQYLWHSTWSTIYKLDPSDGSVVLSFSSPPGGAYGLTWDGQYLWVTSWTSDVISQVDVGAPPPPPNSTGLKVYPNPFHPNDGDPGTGTWEDGITFSALTPKAKIQIFTLSGELVREVDAVAQLSWVWNAENKDGGKVARGVYIYLVTDPSGEKKTGKIAIVK